MSALRFDAQIVAMLPPSLDDRLRTLATRQGVSLAKTLRVTLMVGLDAAERLERLDFLRVHAEVEEMAQARHAACAGRWHELDA